MSQIQMAFLLLSIRLLNFLNTLQNPHSSHKINLILYYYLIEAFIIKIDIKIKHSRNFFIASKKLKSLQFFQVLVIIFNCLILLVHLHAMIMDVMIQIMDH